MKYPPTLTEAQRLLAGENVRLAKWWSCRFHRGFPGVPIEELESLALYALCLAARYYDPARGQFSTYASMNIRQKLGCFCKRWLDKARRTRRLPACPDRTDLPARPEPVKLDPEAPALDVLLERVRGVLTGRQHEALTYRYKDGLTLKEAGRRLGVCKERARQLVERACEAARPRLAEFAPS